MNEFDIIKNYFASQMEHRSDVIHGIGDDAAIVQVPQGHELVITTDTLVAGVHFLETASPYDIGYKSLAVNLSDLAAMGATPAWVTLAITLPHADETWIETFCNGFFTLANRFHVQLIGGDLTHGPLAITVQALGIIPAHTAILRSGATPTDLIYVTGTLGDAGLGLQALQEKILLEPNEKQSVLLRLNQPEPRLLTGETIRGLASAAIDISDGLAADLGHILEQSRVGATIYINKLPLSEVLIRALSYEDAINLAINAGDDYELCFTVPAEKQIDLEKKLSTIPCRYTCIGVITDQPGLNLYDQDGNPYHASISGYQHF